MDFNTKQFIAVDACRIIAYGDLRSPKPPQTEGEAVQIVMTTIARSSTSTMLWSFASDASYAEFARRSHENVIERPFLLGHCVNDDVRLR